MSGSSNVDSGMEGAGPLEESTLAAAGGTHSTNESRGAERRGGRGPHQDVGCIATATFRSVGDIIKPKGTWIVVLTFELLAPPSPFLQSYRSMHARVGLCVRVCEWVWVCVYVHVHRSVHAESSIRMLPINQPCLLTQVCAPTRVVVRGRTFDCAWQICISTQKPTLFVHAGLCTDQSGCARAHL